MGMEMRAGRKGRGKRGGRFVGSCKVKVGVLEKLGMLDSCTKCGVYYIYWVVPRAMRSRVA